MNIPRLLGVLFEIKAQGTTVHLDVRRYPPPTGPLLDTKFHLSRRPRVIAERDDRRVARARQRRGEGGGGGGGVEKSRACLSTPPCLSHARTASAHSSALPLPRTFPIFRHRFAVNSRAFEHQSPLTRLRG